MKIEYTPVVGVWYIEGVGSFNTEEEARKALALHRNVKQLTIKISMDLLNKLNTLAKKRKTTVSKMVRELLEKEVQNG